MAVQSTRTVLGTRLPHVALPDVEGHVVNLEPFRADRPLLVVFACNHCPYVRHVEGELATIIGEYPQVAFAAIMSNDVSRYPVDDVAGMCDQLARTGWGIPYLIDADQAVAQAFGAACTPDFFLFDASGALVYRGAMDTSSPKNGNPLDGSLLRDALDRTIAGQSIPEPHRPAMGCGIKWLSGNEPEAVSFL